MKHLTEEEIIAYIEADMRDLDTQAHITECAVCQNQLAEYQEVLQLMNTSREVDPPSSIGLEVSKAIAEASAPRSGFNYWQIAAAIALLIVGYFGGKLTVEDRSAEILALQSQVEVLKEVAMTNALHTSSASERLQVVNRIEAADPATSKNLIKTLINTLNTDESPNVRYAAAQALVRFSDDAEVRQELALSLELQEDALIQIALISILMEAQEKYAIRPLKKILKEDNISPEVKRQAQIALDVLS
ncbi:MAG: HEAT repeat domain-containing protein [Marinoscillum sp.]